MGAVSSVEDEDLEKGMNGSNYFSGQIFTDIKEKLKEKNTVFEDYIFDKAVLRKNQDQNHELLEKVLWMRPPEICKHFGLDPPQFQVEGMSRFDLRQGELGNCWMVTTVAGLAMQSKDLHKVVPNGQGFETDYNGIFRFNFWHFGRWTEVVVDDLLPVHEGFVSQLIFARSSVSNEFWCALFEKAYAKLYGSYAALESGSLTEAAVDFTGGLSERISMKATSFLESHPEDTDVYHFLKKAVDGGCLVGCSGSGDSSGLVSNHAFTVTGATELNVGGGLEKVVRVRNPWGDKQEWTGEFSDGSDRWNEVNEDEKTQLQISDREDGEFWMTISDFVKNWTTLDICFTSPECMADPLPGWQWTEGCWHGEWKGDSAAGYKNSFFSSGPDAGVIVSSSPLLSNPPYTVDIADSSEDAADKREYVNIIVSLIQKNRRAKNLPDLSLGLYILDSDTRICGKTDVFSGRREVVLKLHLPPGAYRIVPCTFSAGEEEEFLVRVFNLMPDN